MTIEAKFLRRIAIASAVLAAVGFWPVMQAGNENPQVYVAAITGYLLSLGNVLAGFGAVVLARKRGGPDFNLIIFGSMSVRMLLMLALIYFFVQFVKLPPIALVASLFLCYLTFLLIEVQFLWSSSRRTGQTPPPTA